MIELEKLGAPELFSDPRYNDLLRKASAFYNSDKRTVRQSRLQLPFFNKLGIKSKLLLESHGKCVYCEQIIYAEQCVIDRFRPSSGAIDARGSRSAEHYWWLAYDWNNLFAACDQCNFFKGSNFPVANERIPIGIITDYDSIEIPLILNPFRFSPAEHFEYNDRGEAVPKSIWGEHTISALKLNRSPLLARRAEAMYRFSDVGFDVSASTAPSAEFSGLARQIATSKGLIRSWPHPRRTTPRVETPKESTAPRSKDGGNLPFISSISISGLFGLGDVVISIPYSTGERAPCIAILGENGSGKTSILKAITLSMYDAQSLTNELTPVEFLSDPEQIGRVAVQFDNGRESVVEILPNGNVKRTRWDSSTIMLAYGATRLPPDSEHSPPQEPTGSRAINLFNPFSPLRSAGKWLLETEIEKFDHAAVAIKRILDFPDDWLLDRSESNDSNNVRLFINGRSNQIETLSHGYKSVLGLSCDIMQTMLEKWPDTLSAEGIVIIDEIENHLHPLWKMRIVPALRDAFPRVQFIITSHDPLCLRGFDSDEICVVKRDMNGSVDVLGAPPAPDLMRIDEILTSSHFGLRNTLSPRLLKLLDEYYSLLDSPGADPDRLRTLESEVSKLDAPPVLERDKILYKAIDKFISTLPDHSTKNASEQECIDFIDSIATQLRKVR